MEYPNNLQQLPLQQPVITPAPTYRLHMIVIVLIGLVMFGIGFAGGYLFFAKKDTQRIQTSQPIQKNPTVVLSPTSKTTTTSEVIHADQNIEEK